MTLASRIAQALATGALTEALGIAMSHVKSSPTDTEARHFYIDLLIVAGDYERADAQLTLATTFSPEDTMGFARLRNALRAMATRQAWFEQGAVPSFPQGPSELDKTAIRLNLAHRAGDRDATEAALDALERRRGERAMVWNGRRVSDFRDLDDRIPHALEVIMTGGAYLWVDFALIAAITLEPISRPRDLAFRRATLELADGASAPVLLPAIYHASTDNETLALGRETSWVAEASGITTGRGQRCFLAGDELVALHDAKTIEAEPAAEPATHG